MTEPLLPPGPPSQPPSAQPPIPPPPPDGAAVDLSSPNRQSIWAIVFLALRTLRAIGIVQLLLAIGFVVARAPSITMLFVIVAAVALVLFAGAALQWWRYTFQVVDRDLVVRKGVLSQQNLTIPLDRIQSVSIEQKLLHRIVSLVQLSLDTAGTQTAEFTIDAVDQPVAAALQRVAADHRTAPITRPSAESAVAGEVPTASSPDSAPLPGAQLPGSLPAPERTVIAHEPWRVVKIAFTQLPFAGLVVLGPLLALGDDLGKYIPFDLPQLDESDTGKLIWLIPLGLLVVLLGSMLLNLIRVLLADWNLTLRATATGLRRDAGLLSTTSVAASVPRIQRIGVRQGVLERPAALHTVELHTIGNVRMVLPGCEANQVADVRAIALAESEGVPTLDQRVSPQEVFLATRNWTIVAVIVGALLYWPVGWWALLVFVPIPAIWLCTRRQVRLRRWGANSEALGDHRELFGWRRQELLLRKINGVSLRQSMFERRRGLATITAATAAGSISIGMIPIEEARHLRDRLLLAVETDTRPWI